MMIIIMIIIIEDDGAKEATEANYIIIQHILLSWRNFKAIRFGWCWMNWSWRVAFFWKFWLFLLCFSPFPAFAAVAFDALVVFGASTFASASLVAFAAFSMLIRLFLLHRFKKVGNLRIRSIPTKSRSPRIISSFIPLFSCGSAFRGSACAANSPRLRFFPQRIWCFWNFDPIQVWDSS